MSGFVLYNINFFLRYFQATNSDNLIDLSKDDDEPNLFKRPSQPPPRRRRNWSDAFEVDESG